MFFNFLKIFLNLADHILVRDLDLHPKIDEDQRATTNLQKKRDEDQRATTNLQKKIDEDHVATTNLPKKIDEDHVAPTNHPKKIEEMTIEMERGVRPARDQDLILVKHVPLVDFFLIHSALCAPL